MKKIFYWLFVIILCGIYACSDDEKTKVGGVTGAPYDPSQPVVLEAFYPDSGGMAEQVIIKGKNFGNDAEKVKVYYNDKKAAVVETIGDMMYIITPRQPGDTSYISVVIGDDSASFDHPFRYTTQITLSTVAGIPGSNDIADGTLSSGSFAQPRYITVDDENNIFVTEIHHHRLRLVNEKRNVVQTLMNGNGLTNPNAPSIAADGKTLYVPLDGVGMYQFDPELQWTPKKVVIRVADDSEDMSLSGKYMHSIAVNLDDELFYTRTWDGLIFKFEPRTKNAWYVGQGKGGVNSDSYQAFHPTERNMLYVCCSALNSIYTFNLDTKEWVLFAGEGRTAGWQDGERADALFKNPRQICFDDNGTLYIADTGNHVIRQIDSKGIVTTIAGLAGVGGYRNGSPEVSLLKEPWGVAIDKDGVVYIADSGNKLIRKLSIE